MVKRVFSATLLTLLLAFGECNVDKLLNALNITGIPAIEVARIGRHRKTSDGCLTTDGFTGSCMSRFNCMRQSGAVSGFCGTYGVCCETNVQCGSTSKQKRIVLKNPVTLPTTGSCSYIIEPYSTNVCQLRIDFERFSLQQPSQQPPNNEAVECSDRFVVNNLVICGNNDQQHIYIPFYVAGGMDHVQLRFELPNRWTGTNWRLVVTQLECPAAPKHRSFLTAGNPFMNHNSLSDLRNIFTTHNSDLDMLAPPGCLQYHTERSGEVKSINYNNGQGPYLPDMSYAICFKRAFSDNMLQLTTVNFELSQQRDPAMFPGFDEECHGTVVTPMRKEDYVMIPRSVLLPAASLQPTYFCGTGIKKNDMIYSATEGPFVIYFNSDAMTDQTEKGFHFNFQIQ